MKNIVLIILLHVVVFLLIAAAIGLLTSVFGGIIDMMTGV